jgi:hypothetical protein
MMYLSRKTLAFNADNPDEMNQNSEVFEAAMKTADVPFQNLDAAEISLTDVSHYFASVPTAVPWSSCQRQGPHQLHRLHQYCQRQGALAQQNHPARFLHQAAQSQVV